MLVAFLSAEVMEEMMFSSAQASGVMRSGILTLLNQDILWGHRLQRDFSHAQKLNTRSALVEQSQEVLRALQVSASEQLTQLSLKSVRSILFIS